MPSISFFNFDNFSRTTWSGKGAQGTLLNHTNQYCTIVFMHINTATIIMVWAITQAYKFNITIHYFSLVDNTKPEYRLNTMFSQFPIRSPGTGENNSTGIPIERYRPAMRAADIFRYGTESELP